jgi:hypothetical protein
MEVDLLAIKVSLRKNRRSLLLLLGLVVLVQAGLASVNLYLDLSVSPQEIDPGDHVTVFAHVYDTDYPGVKISYQKIIFLFSYPNGSKSATYDTDVTNASGWAARSYTPPTGGRYTVRGNAYVNYSLYPGLPPHNGYWGVSSHDIPFNVTSPYIPLRPVPTAALHIPLGTATTAPVTTTQTTQQTTTVNTATQITPATQTTLVTQVTQTTSAVPAIPAATVQPATSITRVQQVSPGTTGPEEALTTTTAPAATPADIPSYPVPLWLVALIIFVILVAIGGGMYLKSQLDNEEQKK